MKRTVLLSLLAFAGPLLHAAPPDDAAALLQARKYPEAAAAFAALPPDPSGRTVYLNALALHYAGKYDEASTLADKVPAASTWARKARFLKASSLTKAKKHAEAAAIYAEEANRVIDPARRDGLVKALLSLADEVSSDPGASDIDAPPPDFTKARELYARTLEHELTPALRGEVLFKKALAEQRLTAHYDATDTLLLYLREYDPDWKTESPQTKAGVPGPHRCEARLRLTESQVLLGDRAAARATAEGLLALLKIGKNITDADRALAGDAAWLRCRTFAPAPPVQQQVPMQAKQQAAFLQTDNVANQSAAANNSYPTFSQVRRRPPDPLPPDPAGHLEALRAFLKEYPSHKAAPEASLAIAETLISGGKDLEGIAAYNDFIEAKNFKFDAATPANTKVDPATGLTPAEALGRRQQTAFFTIGSIHFQQKRYPEAIAQYRKYTVQYPAAPEWSASQSGIIDAEFQLGLQASAAGDEKTARTRFDDFLTRYPLDPRCRQILFIYGQFPYAAALELEEKKAPAGLTRPLFQKALEEWSRVISKYPDSEEASLALYNTALILSDKLDRLEDGLNAFKRLTWGQWAGPAKNRASVMENKSLAVASERVFRLNETPAVKVSVRNIEKLKVSRYPLDVEAFFRSRHRIDAVNLLDIDLIEPEKTWEVAVNGYARYRSMEQSIPVEFAEGQSGACVIRVEGDDWQATTLVLRSDLDAVVETSPREVLTYVVDAVKQQPAAGVSVLVSDGTQIIATGETGKDGVFRTAVEAVGKSQTVNVFVKAANGVSGNFLARENMKLVNSSLYMSPVLLDRREYTPGSTIQWQAWRREVKDGVITAKPPEEGWKVTWQMPDGRFPGERPVTWTEFGSAAGTLPLPETVVPGTYKLFLLNGRERIITTFEVVATPNTTALLTNISFSEGVDHFPDGTRVILGDREVKGTATLRLGNGKPLPNEPVTLTLPGQPATDTRTGPDGILPFTFSSAGQKDIVSITLKVPRFDVTEFTQVSLTRQEYHLRLANVPETVLAGAETELKAMLTGWHGQGIAKDLSLVVLRNAATGRSRVLEGVPWITDYGLSTAATETTRLVVKTDAAGRAPVRLKIDEPGSYLLRLEGRDSAGNPVETVSALRVAGDSDSPVRLLVRTAEMAATPLPQEITPVPEEVDPLVVRLGSPLRLFINSRVALPNALVTVHAQNFISHQVMALAAGNNALEIPIAAAHVPDFRVTVTVLEGRKIHGASRAFVVESPLRLTAEGGRFAPGAALTLVDQAGKPVAAEFRVIMRTELTAPLFPNTNRPPLRGGKLSIESSAAFSHPGSSRRRLVAPGTGLISYAEASNDQVVLMNIQQAELNFNGGNTFLRDNYANFIVGCSFIDREVARHGDILLNKGISTMKIDAFDVPGLPAFLTDLSYRPLTGPAPVPEKEDPAGPERAGAIIPSFTSRHVSGADGKVTIPVPNDGKNYRRLTIVAGAKDSLLTVMTVILPPGEAPVAAAPSAAPKDRADFVTAGGIFPAGTFTLKLDAPANAADSTLRIVAEASPLHALARLAMEEGRLETDEIQEDGESLLGTVAALQLAVEKKADAAIQDALRERIHRLLDRLGVSEKDGGWSWGGLKVAPDILSTATTWRALIAAKNAGFAVNDKLLERVDKFLTMRWADIPVTDYEKKAVVLHARAVAGKADYSQANALYRGRESLSEVALAHLCATFLHMGREEEARGVLDLLLKKAVKAKTTDGRDTLFWPGSKSIVRLSEREAVTSTVLWSLRRLQANTPEVDAAAAWLLNSPAAVAGGFTHSRGQVVMALAAFLQGRKDLEIKAGEVAVKSAEDKTNLTFTNEKPAPVWVTIRRTFFVPVEDRKPWEYPRIAARHFFHAPYEQGDIRLGSLGSSPVKQAAFGERVRLVIQPNNDPTPGRERHDNFLILEEQIPGGFTVEEGRIAGNFDRMERRGNLLRFYYAPGTLSQLTIPLVATAPGEWEAPATLLMDAYDRDRFRAGTPATLTVLPPGKATEDVYVLNTAEHLELARLLFDRGDHDGCLRELAAVEAARNPAVESEKDIARMRLWILTTRPDADAAAIVQAFEILTSRHPDLVIPFDKILRVGDAYRRYGEHERGGQVYHAALDGAFLRDSGVSAALEDAGDYAGSVDYQEALWREYPDSSQDVVDSLFALAQSLSTRAPDAEKIPVRRGKPKLEKNALLTRSGDLLRGYLTLYPADANADDAAFSLVNVHFALKDYPGVVTAATAGAARHPESPFLNSFQYMAALGHFWQGDFDKALAAAAPVANGDSKDRDYARYVTAQVHHAMGKPALAIEWYQKVKTVYPDAADAISWFEEKHVGLPEVSVFKPGAEVKLTLDYRNIKEASVQLYKVDLMKLYLREKSLSNIARVNLAGIKPEGGETVALGDGKDFAGKQRVITLSVKEEGAYLAIVRGDDLFTSGLVVISPLKLEVKEIAAEGRVRLNLTDALKGSAVSEAEVKALASESTEVSSGTTDPRGVYEATGLKGLATIIVRQGTNRYAFHRGTQLLASTAPAAPEVQSNEGKSKPKGRVLDKEEYLNNLNDTNRGLQESQIQNWDNKRRSNNKGVEAKDVFKK